MLFHIPHSKTSMPVEYPLLPKDYIDNYTDWYTDELFVHSAADRLVFPYSRFYVDVERLLDDPLDKVGNGLFYTHTPDGKIQYRSKEHDYDHAFTLFYDWHKKLRATVNKNMSYTEKVVLVDCHSFSNEQADATMPWNKGRHYPDIGIGFNDSANPEFIEWVGDLFEDVGFNIGMNFPYSNSIQPVEDANLYSVMIEVNKALYLTGIEKSGNFDNTKKAIHGVLDKLSKFELG
jgi:N-formylglutamate amidohydrolase